jgi:hypothetical protein
MASILWSLSYALPSAPSSFIGPSSLASLGLARPRRRLVSQGTSTLSFRRAGAAVDAAYLFPWGTIVKMFRNGVPWFYGVVTQTPSAGSGRAEDQDYVVSDPWWYLENLVYQQQWIAPSYPGANTTNDPYRSHCFLNKWIFNALSNNFTRETTDQQIADVIAYAQSAPSNVPIQLPSTPGTVPSMDIPLEEIRDATCADVLRKQLRWMPDAVTWFDYSTTPPTLNIQRRANLAPVSVPFPTPASPSPLAEFAVDPCYGLFHESVKISFERQDDVIINGQTQSWFLNTPTVYPPSATGREVTALVSTIKLEGFNDKAVAATISVGATSSAAHREPISSGMAGGWQNIRGCKATRTATCRASPSPPATAPVCRLTRVRSNTATSC